MKTVRPLSALMFVCLILPASAQDRHFLEYRFDEGETLRYRTESRDSTTQGSDAGAATVQMTRWSLLSLSVPKKKSDSYQIVVKVDSAWDDGESDGAMTSEGGGRRMTVRRGPGRPGMHRNPEEFEITRSGHSAGREEVSTPLILPLPDQAVAVNETWTFEKNIERKGRMSGTTRITGQCLLYDFQEQDGRDLALILVNSETTGEGQFRFRRPGQDAEISGTSRSRGGATSLVYFDIGAGRIIEIVNDEIRDTATESPMFSSTISLKSTSTIRLIPD